MNSKTFYFLASLPRSGSTLLTTLLDQNPNIHSTYGTSIPSIFRLLDKTFLDLEPVIHNQNLLGYDNLLKNLYPSFFSHINKPIIIDKLPRQEDPITLINTMKICNPNFKVIFTVRPILEILASFIKLCRNTPDINVYDKNMKEYNYFPLKYRDIDEARCDWLMEKTTVITSSIDLLYTALSSEYKENFLIIKYEDLTLDTENTINKIYKFLNVLNYNHNYYNIKGPNFDDFKLYGIPNLHTVKKTIIKSNIDYKIFLSEYTINKYKNLLDFSNIF
jgi:sulfotransferase